MSVQTLLLSVAITCVMVGITFFTLEIELEKQSKKLILCFSLFKSMRKIQGFLNNAS